MPLLSRPLSFVSPRAEHLGHAGKGGHVVHHRLDVAGDREEIEIAHRVACRGGSCRPLRSADRLGVPHVGEDFLHEPVGLGPEDALVGLGGEGEAGEDRFFGLLAKPLQFADFVAFAGLREVRRA